MLCDNPIPIDGCCVCELSVEHVMVKVHKGLNVFCWSWVGCMCSYFVFNVKVVSINFAIGAWLPNSDKCYQYSDIAVYAVGNSLRLQL